MRESRLTAAPSDDSCWRVLTAIIILVACCVLTGIYLYIVKEQLDESERAE